MDFTREPIIESIITPREGCKLSVKNTKQATAHEDYLVDALQLVSFGQSFFFRSIERPYSFLVPVNDYEIVEVRETRMVLKSSTVEKSIKIGGGREGQNRVKETEKTSKQEIEKPEIEIKEERVAQRPQKAVEITKEVAREVSKETGESTSVAEKTHKKHERRIHHKKKQYLNEKQELQKIDTSTSTQEEKREELAAAIDSHAIPPLEEGKVPLEEPHEKSGGSITDEANEIIASSLVSSLLQPPPMLISETINRYRKDSLFKTAFFLPEEENYVPHEKVADLLNDEEPYQTQSFGQEHAKEVEMQQEPLESSEKNLLSMESQEAPLQMNQEEIGVELPETEPKEMIEQQEIKDEPKRKNDRPKKEVSAKPILPPPPHLIKGTNIEKKEDAAQNSFTKKTTRRKSSVVSSVDSKEDSPVQQGPETDSQAGAQMTASSKELVHQELAGFPVIILPPLSDNQPNSSSDNN